MRLTVPVSIALAWTCAAPSGAATTVPRPAAPAATAAAPTRTPVVPKTVDGYVGTLEMETSVSGMKEGGSTGPEAQAFLGQLRDKARLQTKIYLAQDLSRQEVVSTDFILPAGTVILHEAGAKFYCIADPKAQTYSVIDAEGIMKALEGGIGITNSEYSAKVTHTTEKKMVGNVSCRRSVVRVSYVSSIPFENDNLLVQQTNEIEVWHTAQYVSSALLDHFFFKFQRDRTGTVQKVVSAELGFPMELSMSIAQGSGNKVAPAGALKMSLSDVHVEKRLPSELFAIPPAGYRKVERSPFMIGKP
jgi:hypothetical protein